MPHTLRLATAQDAQAIAAIYAHYVENTVFSFEYTPPTAAEMARRIAATAGAFPYLVCQNDGQLEGYAYGTGLGTRQGYNWAAVPSVYIVQNVRGGGLGRRLYGALQELLAAQGYRTLTAIIAHPNPDSEAFHRKMGFVQQGLLPNVGYKFGQPLSVSYFGKELLPVTENPAPPRRFDALDEALVAEVLCRHSEPSRE